MALIKKYALLITLMFSIGALNAQTIKNYIITPAAGTYQVDGLSGYWSLGEIENGNRQVGDLLVIQGFAKGNFTAQITSVPEEFDFSVKTFPNPVQDQLHIEWGQLPKEEFNYQIYNNVGVLFKEGVLATSNHSSDLDLSALGAGTYHLHIFTTNSTQPISIKIIKTQSR